MIKKMIKNKKHLTYILIITVITLTIFVITYFMSFYEIDITLEYIKNNRSMLASNIKIILFSFSREDWIDIITNLGAFFNLLFLTLMIPTEDSEEDPESNKNSFNPIVLFCEKKDDNLSSDKIDKVDTPIQTNEDKIDELNYSQDEKFNDEESFDDDLKDSPKKDKGKGKLMPTDNLEQDDKQYLQDNSDNEDLKDLLNYQYELDHEMAMHLSEENIEEQERLLEYFKNKYEVTQEEIEDYDDNSTKSLSSYSIVSSTIREDDDEDTKAKKELLEEELKNLREEKILLEEKLRSNNLEENISKKTDKVKDYELENTKLNVTKEFSSEYSVSKYGKRKIITDDTNEAGPSNWYEKSDQSENKKDSSSYNDKGKKRAKKDES